MQNDKDCNLDYLLQMRYQIINQSTNPLYSPEQTYPHVYYFLEFFSGATVLLQT